MQSTPPLSSSGPVVGSGSSSFRPVPPASSQFRAPPFSSGPVVGSEVPAFRPPSSGRSNELVGPPPSSSSLQGPPTAGFQRFPTPSLPSVGHAVSQRTGQPLVPPPTRPAAGTVASPPISLLSQPQPPSIPMGSPPPSMKSGLINGNIPPPAHQPLSSSRPNVQPSSPVRPSYVTAPGTSQATFPGYVNTQPNTVAQAPSLQPASFTLQQGVYAPGAPPTPFLAQQRSANPPSLYFRKPNAASCRIDTAALPRPLDGDVEPSSLAEMYPMNCSSRSLRLTTSGIPNSMSLASRWHLPLGAIVCPLAEPPTGEEVPIINFVTTGIIRCKRCRTYVNPFVSFTDNGRKWKCNICSILNDVPGDYFAHVDASGRRVDLDQRPELTQGTIEFIAPAEYMVRPPMPPLYFFLIDVSISAVKSGMIEVMAQTIKSCLDSLPGYPRTQIGFITYDSTIHFYNMKSSLMQPQMMVVSDLDDVFIPLPDDLLVNLSESRNVVDAFLDSLPSMFQDNTNVESALAQLLKLHLRSWQLGGKLLIFQNTLPSLGVGRLRLRGDDIRVYGTDKEPALRAPEDPFYKQMAADLTKYQIAVNIYAFSDKYTDIASLGVRFTSYHGNFMLRSTDLLALPAVDCDKAYAAQLSLEETLLTTQTVYFQVALLYTSSSGERRIRVHTAAAPVVADLGEMYRLADTGAIISLFSRLAIEKSLSHKLEDARNAVQLRIVKTLREYRNLYAVQHRLSGKMIDERCAAGYTMMALPVKKLLKLLYPNLVRMDDSVVNLSPQTDESDIIRKRLPLTAESLDPRGLYIFDDGFRFIIWLGRSISPDIVRNLVGEDFTGDYSKVSLSARDNEMSRKLMKILNKFRENDLSYYQFCHVVRQAEQPREGFFLLGNLVDDQNGGANSYADWILQLHRQVQQNT
ncbi:UNVERIFIED_CONTAM: protein transport protein Sec24-like [Sesamum calycinum]|uniref:Protein transport protein Sec24-like n=1 Tax=Sesamum calycinum TaxID=2727403 RepID=A0AAW2SEW2_9LAMI